VGIILLNVVDLLGVFVSRYQKIMPGTIFPGITIRGINIFKKCLDSILNSQEFFNLNS
jgi:hypothetical protein